MEGIIYKWTNKINNKVYIGKTTNEERRIKEHLTERRFKSAFHDALDKYGKDTFDYCVLIKTTSKDNEKMNIFLNAMERYYIKKYKSNIREFGYNLTEGGDGFGSRFGEANPFYGKHHTEECKKAHSLRMKGRKQTEETIKKKKDSLKKVEHTEEWNKKVGIANQKPITAYKDGKIVGSWLCYNDCMNALNLPNIKGISKVVHGMNKTYKGYTFV